jgi:hypothetical protein
MGLFGSIIKHIRSGFSSSYGTFKRDRDIAKLFEEGRVLPDFTYYTTGSDAEPMAILGIHNDYSLRSRLWKEVELNESALKSWVKAMSSDFEYAPMTSGFLILDDAERTVGIFYAMKKTKVKIEKNNAVIVHLPDEFPRLDQG